MPEQEEKEFQRYPQYCKLSDEQKQEFKKALFLTKGAVNNDVGCLLASLGLPGEDIAKYGASWKDAKGVSQGGILRVRHDPYGPRARGPFTWKCLLQQAARIPDLFDTIRGRVLVAKHGEEIKDEFCDKEGRCPVSVIYPDNTYERMLDCVEFIKGSETEYTFRGIRNELAEERNLCFDRKKASRLKFLEETKASEIAKAKSKGIDLAEIYARSTDTGRSQRSKGDGLEDYPELNRDFWGFLKQDLKNSSLKNKKTFFPA